MERIDAATQRQLGNTLTLAQQLGAVPMTFKGSEVVSTIAAFVKEYGITHILLGRTLRPGTSAGSDNHFWTGSSRQFAAWMLSWWTRNEGLYRSRPHGHRRPAPSIV